MTVSLAEQIDSVLSEFENHIPYVQATALFDTDGLVISSRLPGGVDEQKIGAMTAAILSISNRSGEELERGNMKRILVEGDSGSIVIMSVGNETVLVALVGQDVKLGILFYECRQCISQIMNIMQ